MKIKMNKHDMLRINDFKSHKHADFKKWLIEMFTRVYGEPNEDDLKVVNEIMDETYMNTLILVEDELYKKFPGHIIIKQVLDSLKDKI